MKTLSESLTLGSWRVLRFAWISVAYLSLAASAHALDCDVGAAPSRERVATLEETVAGGLEVQALNTEPVVGFEIEMPGVDWQIVELPSWLSSTPASSTESGRLRLSVEPTNMSPGVYDGSLAIQIAEELVVVRIRVRVTSMVLERMIADLEKPYVYGMHRGANSCEEAFLVIIRTDDDAIDRVVPLGTGVTDFTLHHADRRLYVAHGKPEILALDLDTSSLLPPIPMPHPIHEVNAARSGAIVVNYLAGFDYYIGGAAFFEFATGKATGATPSVSGDGESDPRGERHFHTSTYAIFGLTSSEFGFAKDADRVIANLVKSPFQEIVISPDGSRLFFRRLAIDTQTMGGKLRVLLPAYWDEPIRASTLRGNIVFSGQRGFNVDTGKPIYTFPFEASAVAVAGDQSKVLLADPINGRIVSIPLEQIAEVEDRSLALNPPSGAVVILPLDSLSWSEDPIANDYDIYFGNNADDIRNAGPGSAHHLGRVNGNRVALASDLAPGGTYYWRVDARSPGGIRRGDVATLTIAPIIFSPSILRVDSLTLGPPSEFDLLVNSPTPGVAWRAEPSTPWLSLSDTTGATPAKVSVTIDISGLGPGLHHASVDFVAGGLSFSVPVDVRLEKMQIDRMIADFERPRIYALHGGPRSWVAALNARTGKTLELWRVGAHASDLTIDYDRRQLFVAGDPIYRIDLANGSDFGPLAAAGERVNATLGSRLFVEAGIPGKPTHVSATTHRTLDMTPALSKEFRSGDAELDPTGQYYFRAHGDFVTADIQKYEVSSDSYRQVAGIRNRAFGSKHLVMSADGQRLFGHGFVYDNQLREIGDLGVEILATTLHGDVAISAESVIDVATGAPLLRFPTSTRSVAVAGNQATIVRFPSYSGGFEVIRMGEIQRDPAADCPGDCYGDREVDVGDLLLSVGISLGEVSRGSCRASDRDRNGRVDVPEVVAALNMALHGCGEP